MKQSESIAKLAAALVAVQGEVRGVAKDSTNPDFRSQYTSLDAIIEKTRPILTKHGLAVVQGATTPHSDEAGRIAAVAVETMLVHQSGEWLTNTAVMPVVGRMLKGGGRGDVDPQAGGSALTYGRRYGLAALLCLSTDEDDDGNAASKPARSQRSEAPKGGTGASAGGSTSASPTAAGASASPPTSRSAADKIMPFGKTKGKRLGDLTINELTGAATWCRDTDSDRFKDLIDALDAVAADKSESHEDAAR